jgi:hypothetical protein
MPKFKLCKFAMLIALVTAEEAVADLFDCELSGFEVSGRNALLSAKTSGVWERLGRYSGAG